MATKVGELFVDLVIDAATGKMSVRQLVGALGDLQVSSVATVSGLTKIAEAFIDLAKSATDTAVSLTALHDIAGADPKVVQQWEKAAQSVTGHAGTIIKAITSVNEINKGLATGKGAPAELTYLLGLSAYKKDAQGREVVKDAMDLMREMASPGSKYRSLSPLVQQSALGGVFGAGNADDVFRVINAMSRGSFHPERFSAMNDRQVGELNQVRMKELQVVGELTGIFQHLLVGGSAFARVLDTIDQKLQVLDKWLESKQGVAALDAVGKSIDSGVRNATANPLKGFGLFGMGRDLGQFTAEKLLGPLPRLATGGVQVAPLTGVLDINLLRDYKVVDTKRMRLEADRQARERMAADATWGNP